MSVNTSLLYRKDFIVDEVHCILPHQAPHIPISSPTEQMTSAKPLLCRGGGAEGPLGSRSAGPVGRRGNEPSEEKEKEQMGGMQHTHFPRVGRVMVFPLPSSSALCGCSQLPYV